MAVSARVSVLQQTAVNSILAEVRQLQVQGHKAVSLMRGEPDFPTPSHIVEAAAAAMRSGRTTYPDNRGEPKLRQAIAEKLSRENGLAYDPDSEILVTTGATFGIYAALTALLNDGDEVLLPDPIYDAYQSPIRLAGGRPSSVAAKIVDGRFQLDVAALEAACTPASKVLLLNTPWNPVGSVLRESEINQVAEFVERHNLVLISDEIYEAITYTPHRHVSPGSAGEALRARTVIVNSLSKTYAMTGWRVGYCAAPKQWIAAMFLVLQQSSRGPSMFVQDSAAAALSGPQECVDQMRAEYARRRARVLERLAGIENIEVLAPEGGFFAMVDARRLGIPSDELRRRLLRESGVVVVHGSAYGACGEGTLRVSFASGGENLEVGLTRLREGLERIV